MPFSSPGHLPNPGIEPRSPASQADSLPSERRAWVGRSGFYRLPWLHPWDAPPWCWGWRGRGGGILGQVEGWAAPGQICVPGATQRVEQVAAVHVSILTIQGNGAGLCLEVPAWVPRCFRPSPAPASEDSWSTLVPRSSLPRLSKGFLFLSLEHTIHHLR